MSYTSIVVCKVLSSSDPSHLSSSAIVLKTMESIEAVSRSVRLSSTEKRTLLENALDQMTCDAVNRLQQNECSASSLVETLSLARLLVHSDLPEIFVGLTHQAYDLNAPSVSGDCCSQCLPSFTLFRNKSKRDRS
jgi:hypothetical protein